MRELSQVCTTKWAKAAQVQPPLNKRELVSIFLSMLASSFYEHRTL